MPSEKWRKLDISICIKLAIWSFEECWFEWVQCDESGLKSAKSELVVAKREKDRESCSVIV